MSIARSVAIAWVPLVASACSSSGLVLPSDAEMGEAGVTEAAGIADAIDAPSAQAEASANPDAVASTDASDAESGACSPVVASDYDQSCMADTDCVGVSEVASCPAPGCDCQLAAINKTDSVRYMAALAQAIAKRPAGGLFCECGCIGLPICRGAKCESASCNPPQEETLPGCADAGGRCFYSSGTCTRNGPPDSCAYSDETCCLQ